MMLYIARARSSTDSSSAFVIVFLKVVIVL